jgi:hypothetical protein
MAVHFFGWFGIARDVVRRGKLWQRAKQAIEQLAQLE